MDDRGHHKFSGYSRPNYTPVPDQLFDDQLPDLSGAELKALLYIIRRTFGFKKESDNISLNQMLHGITTKAGKQLDRGTGLSRSTLIEALKGLVEKGHIIAEQRSSRERGNEATNYRLNVLPLTPDLKIEPGESGNQTGPVRESDPQETARQETDGQHRGSMEHAPFEERTQDQSLSPSRESRIRPGGLASVADVIDRGQGRLRSSTLTAHTSQLEAAIAEITEEFHDTGHLRSNLNVARRLMDAARVPETAFLVRLYEARAITRQQALFPGRGSTPRRKVPYMFAVLRDLLDLREPSGASEE
jgi:hypothetical protein